MTSNFVFIERNIDVSGMLQQVLDSPDDWQAVSTWSNTAGKQNPLGFLPLVMAVVRSREEDVRHSELLQLTPFYEKYTGVRNYLKDKHGIENLSRAAFFKLFPGGSVKRHIDDGNYYLTRDRYHLSLQGRYMYEVDGEEHIIEPGTFFWFDNKKQHQAQVVGEQDRITFVFDVVHSPNNPHHKIQTL